MEENTQKYFKYCLVPLCKSTTIKTPNKIFIRLPFERNRRTKWLEACQRDLHDISSNSNALHVCEDHFNLEEDMDNYMRFKLMGGIKKMKQCVVPHIFDCQTNKNGASAHTARAAALKKVKRQPVQKAVASTSNSTEPLKDQNISGIKSNMITMGPSYEYDNHTNEVSAHTSKRTLPKIRSKGVQCKLYSGVPVSLSPRRIIYKHIRTLPGLKGISNLPRCYTCYSESSSIDLKKNMKYFCTYLLVLIPQTCPKEKFSLFLTLCTSGHFQL